jgi:hypothetical protein
MQHLLISVSDSTNLNALKTSLMKHKGVEKVEIALEPQIKGEKETVFDPNIYDADGNFQWISMAAPGLPVPNEYMAWRLEQAQKSIAESKGIPLEEVMASFENRVKQMLTSK